LGINTHSKWAVQSKELLKVARRFTKYEAVGLDLAARELDEHIRVSRAIEESSAASQCVLDGMGMI
jgi:hypothetical protein